MCEKYSNAGKVSEYKNELKVCIAFTFIYCRFSFSKVIINYLNRLIDLVVSALHNPPVADPGIPKRGGGAVPAR